MTPIIDWNEIWKLAHTNTPPSPDPWESRAEFFERHIQMISWATDEIVARFKCKSTDTVLDIGAGTGRYAIPLASQVASVTAIEPSPAMRTILEKKLDAGPSNVVTVPLPWEDITIGKDVMPHDVVLASHSFTMYDLKEALLKIQQAAKREVWLILFAGSRKEAWTRDILVKSGIDEDFKKRPFDYLIIYSMLHSLGIYADVSIHTYAYSDVYLDVETAVEDWRSMYNVPPENEIFTQEITRLLTREGDMYYLLPRTSRIAIIHWQIHNDKHLD